MSTSGGVGGREPRGSLLPDCLRQEQVLRRAELGEQFLGAGGWELAGGCVPEVEQGAHTPAHKSGDGFCAVGVSRRIAGIVGEKLALLGLAINGVCERHVCG